nr:unnamed protein product [Callosobruchus chinensis]
MLSYSPKHETVQKKLKLLPVKYLRVFADTEEEFKLLSTGLKRFKELNFFPLEDEEVTSEPVPSTSSSSSSEHHHQRSKRGYLLITLPYHQSYHK